MKSSACIMTMKHADDFTAQSPLIRDVYLDFESEKSFFVCAPKVPMYCKVLKLCTYGKVFQSHRTICPARLLCML